jgi:hypothetical protein
LSPQCGAAPSPHHLPPSAGQQAGQQKPSLIACVSAATSICLARSREGDVELPRAGWAVPLHRVGPHLCKPTCARPPETLRRSPVLQQQGDRHPKSSRGLLPRAAARALPSFSASSACVLHPATGRNALRIPQVGSPATRRRAATLTQRRRTGGMLTRRQDND